MASQTPRILDISLHSIRRWLDNVFPELLTALESKAEFQRAENSTSAISLLSQHPGPSAVLITDEALTLQANIPVWKAVLAYVRRGGTAIIMSLLYVRPNHVKPFFSRAGLDWERASPKQRTILTLNLSAAGVADALNLPYRCSQRAVFINNVAEEDMWYKIEDDSGVQSVDFPPTSANVAGQTAVALAKVGQGKLGYVGDIRGEDASTSIVLAMCGLV
ncbi:hypothetical protein VB005_03599 [Metarhizium brunneum]